MQKSYIPLNIGQSKTQESTLQASLFFKQWRSREIQLLCDPYIKLVLKLRYFDSHFLLLRATVYKPAKASTHSSMCVNTDNPAPQPSLQEISFQSLWSFRCIEWEKGKSQQTSLCWYPFLQYSQKELEETTYSFVHIRECLQIERLSA